MADFLTNLLLRNTRDQSAIAILQPRLPSLFEPLYSSHEIPIPPPDPVVRETFAPTAESSATGFQQSKLRINPLTLPSENNQLTVSQQEGLPAQRVREQDISQRFQAVMPTTLLDEPPRTIFPSDAHQSSLKARPFSQGGPHVQTAGEFPHSTTVIKNPLQTGIRAIQEDSLTKKELDSHLEPLPLRTTLRSVTTLQPILPAPRPAGIQQFERSEDQERQRVVEIHIGRIEVRATPAPVVQQTKPRSTATMGLDKYLRSRSGDKK